MTITLTPEQQGLMRDILASGAVSSEEEALTVALLRLRDSVSTDLAGRFGLSVPELRDALEAGRRAPSRPWEGPHAFTRRMSMTDPDETHGGSDQ